MHTEGFVERNKLYSYIFVVLYNNIIMSVIKSLKNKSITFYDVYVFILVGACTFHDIIPIVHVYQNLHIILYMTHFLCC